MRRLIMLTIGVGSIYMILNAPGVNQAFKGYEDYFLALALSALIAPFIAPLWD